MHKDPGIYPGTKRSEYELIQAANYSTLKHFAKSAMHARREMVTPSEPSDAMELGTAIHTLLLEPERYATEYVTAPKCDRRTREGKATWESFTAEFPPGRHSYLKADDADVLKAIANNIASHDLAGPLLAAKGLTELCVVWIDRQTGVKCKCLIDTTAALAGFTFVVDIKSAQDASPEAFPRSVASLLYHEQAAFYLSGLSALAPASRRFVWLAVETKPPHGVAVYEPDDEALAEGEFLYTDHLRQYQDAQKSGVWPGYPGGVQTLKLPPWARKRGE